MSFEKQEIWFDDVTPTNTKSATINIGAGANGTVTVTIDAYGDEGNNYTIEVSDGGASDCPMTATLNGMAIVVELGKTGAGLEPTKNTATLVAGAIDALTGISATASGTGADSLGSAEAETNLTGGTYATVCPIPNALVYVDPYYYTNIAPNSRSDNNWRRFQLENY